MNITLLPGKGGGGGGGGGIERGLRESGRQAVIPPKIFPLKQPAGRPLHDPLHDTHYTVMAFTPFSKYGPRQHFSLSSSLWAEGRRTRSGELE